MKIGRVTIIWIKLIIFSRQFIILQRRLVFLDLWVKCIYLKVPNIVFYYYLASSPLNRFSRMITIWIYCVLRLQCIWQKHRQLKSLSVMISINWWIISSIHFLIFILSVITFKSFIVWLILLKVFSIMASCITTRHSTMKIFWVSLSLSFNDVWDVSRFNRFVSICSSWGLNHLPKKLKQTCQSFANLPC